MKPGKDAADVYKITCGAEEIRKKRHLVSTTETPEGVKTVSTYDEYGNLVSKRAPNSNVSPELSLQTTKLEYTEDGDGERCDHHGVYLPWNHADPHEERHR